jgi:hypothetical protein
LYDFYSEQIEACDEEIEKKFSETRPDWDAGELPPLPPHNAIHTVKTARRRATKFVGI